MWCSLRMCILIKFRQLFDECPSFVQFLSNICPSFVCPKRTNIGKIFKMYLEPWRNIYIRQKLDKYWTWTKSWQIGQAILLPVLSISLTKLGQNFDNSLSNICPIWKNLGEGNTSRQILDNNGKYWTKYGQIFDKT